MAAEEAGVQRFALKASQLNEIVGLLSTLTEETKWEFTNDGLKVKAVDSSHVAMVIVEMPSAAFAPYEVRGEREVGYDLNKLKDVLKTIPEEERGNPLLVELPTEKLNKHRLVVSLVMERLMMPYDLSGHKDPKIPRYDLPGRIEVNTALFRRAIKSLEAITDHCFLTMEPERDLLFLEGEADCDKVTWTLNGVIRRHPENKVSSIFPLDYLGTMFAAIRAERVEIGLGDEYPLRVDFNLAEGPGTCEFLLAPRLAD